MNRTSNSTNTIKFNYAQAAAQPKSKQHQNPHHQNQQQQQQKIQQTNSPSHSNNPASSVNGKPSQKSQPPTNSTLSNGNAGRSAPENKVAQQKNGVTLPAKARQWEPNTSIQFGSINQPSANPPLSSSPVQSSLVSGGKIPSSLSLPKNGTPTFGTVTARGPSEELVQPTPTQPAIAPTSSGSATGTKTLATRIQNEIPRTQSAPPLLNPQDPTNAKNVGQPSGHQMNTMTSRTQQQLPAATPLQPISTSNPPHHRKDSVSSTVSSNDGQQTQSYHPHQPQPHHNNYNAHYSRHIRPTQVPPQYHRGARDKNVPGTIPPSSHSNPQSVANQIQAPVPMTGPQTTTIPMQMWPSYGRQYDPPPPYYPPYTYYMPTVIQRPPTMPVAPHITQNVSQYTTPGQLKSHAIAIINPNDKSVVNALNVRPPVNQAIRREEISVPGIVDVKRTEDVDKEKEQVLDNDRKESKAVPIVNPVDKNKIELEKKEKEEREQKEREEEERRERERVEREKEKERLEKEERERKEKEEKERIEREQKEREEKERKEREEKERKEREEKERKEREEKERKEREEREERERKEREEKERKEREERERKEREEKEREERERKEREEKERKEREEKERKEREEKERKELEEKERKEREEKERLEQERLEREEKERREREEVKQKEKEAERIAQEERERAEQEEMESQKKKKEAEEEEKKKEFELPDKKDAKEEKKYGKGHRPEALDLSRTTSAPALGTGPLSSARIIDDLSSVQYPAHIKSPNPALNVGSDPGKFKYDRGFLMQFMEVCKDKPENLPALDAVGMEETKDDKKGGLRNSRPTSRASPHIMKNPSGQSQFTQMGEFKKSDSNYGPRSGFRSTLGSRTGSGSMMLPPQAIMNPPSPSRMQNSARRNDKHKKTQHGQNIGTESVVPLEVSENRWVPMMHTKEMDDHMETIQRKVKALLNKLTLEKFDTISDQIIEFANKSREETDGRILKEVISLTFDKSCDEPNFSQMYAQLCRKMMERIDTNIIDENIKNSENKYVQGGALFRKYLLNRCQENFEKGWKVNIPVPSNEKGEPDLMSDEYYTAAKAKRHGLGLIRFIGELFKLNMLTERIMHECIKKLLTSPEEEEMESLCKLLTTVGQQLDHVKAKSHMDTYFSRMEDLSKDRTIERNMKLSSRIRFMILDVIELRNNNWVPRRDNNAPKTIAEIHEDAAKQKEEAEFMRRTASSGGRGLPKMADQMSRAGSGRRGDKGSGPHGSGGQQADGWSTVGSGSSSASRKTGDLSKFGSVRNKVSGSVNLTPGGGGAFGSKWKSENKDRDDKTLGMSRVNSASNMYSVLTHTDTEPRKSSDGPLERKKLQLTSRTIPEEGIKSIMTKSSSSIPPPMSEETAMKKIDNMIAEYFNVLDLGEVVICVNELPKTYHSKAITEFANKVLEKKQEDVYKVINVFRKLASEDVIPKSVFMDGFVSTMEFLIEISTDAPKSYTFAGQLLYGSSIELKEVAELLKPLSGVDDKGIEKVMAGFLDEWKKESNEQEIVKKVKDASFDFKSSIFPKKNIDEINKFLDEHGLGSLKK